MANTAKTPTEAKTETPTGLRAVAIGGGKTKKDGTPTDFICVLAAVDSTGAPVGVPEVLKGPHPLLAGLTVEQHFTSAAKAERAGLDHWPQATIDINAMVKAFEIRERARIPAKVAAERERIELVQRTRQLAARKGITLDEAREQMAQQAEKLAASRGDDDNVLADVTNVE